MRHATKLAAALALAATTLITGCGTTTLSQVRDGTTDHPVWPAADKARPLVESTVHPGIETLRKIRPGMTKTEVYRLLGHPHFREGIAGVHEWDYAFKLRGAGNEATCQYKILFDDAMRSAQSFWFPASCAGRVDERPDQKASGTHADHPHRDRAEAVDVYFTFDSVALDGNARTELTRYVTPLLAPNAGVDEIRVIGHADRFGGRGYNEALSLRRAGQVREFLLSLGAPPQKISISGRGNLDPKVRCADSPQRGTAIACLAPNRRVEVRVLP